MGISLQPGPRPVLGHQLGQGGPAVRRPGRMSQVAALASWIWTL